jgi:hypothetical protein
MKNNKIKGSPEGIVNKEWEVKESFHLKAIKVHPYIHVYSSLVEVTMEKVIFF